MNTMLEGFVNDEICMQVYETFQMREHNPVFYVNTVYGMFWVSCRIGQSNYNAF